MDASANNVLRVVILAIGENVSKKSDSNSRLRRIMKRHSRWEEFIH